MIQVQCNACGTTHQIDSSSAGTVVACSVCSNQMRVPAMAKPVVKSPPAATPVGGPPPLAKPAVPLAHPSAPTPASPAAMASPLPPHLATTAASAAHSPPGMGTSLPDSQNIDRSASQVVSKARKRRKTGFAGKLLFGLVCTILVAAVVLGAYAAIKYLPNISDSSKTAKRNGEDADLSATTKSPWADVSQGNLAQRLNGMKVQVLHVDFGEVLAKDVNNKVQSSEGSFFLQFFLRIENTTKQEIDYRSWYGNVFKNLDGQKSVATLADNEDRKYQMMTFGDVVTVKGHVPSATLKTRNVAGDRKYVEDVLIFDVPADVVPENVKYFRLELPAAAVDGKGHFRFQIPGSMVNQSSEIPPLEPPSSNE